MIMSKPFDDVIQAITKGENGWSNPIMCKGRTMKDEPTISLDICRFFKRPSLLSLEVLLHPDAGFVFNPLEFKGVDKQADLVIYVQEACRLAGFELMVDWNTTSKRKTKYSLSKVHFKCRHNQVLDIEGPESCDEGTPRKKKRKSKSSFKASEGVDACPFRFKVICDPKDMLWYLCFADTLRNGVNVSICHHGHCSMDPYHIPLSMKMLKKTHLDLINTCMRARLSPQQIAEVCKADVSQKQGYISISQAEYIKSTYSELSSMFSELRGDLTSAEKVIKLMDKLIEQGMDIDYRVLVQSKDHEITIRNPRGRPRKGEGRTNSLKSIRKGLRVNEGSDVLLALAWISGEEKELIRRFPEIISADVTERTNKEKRPLYLFCGLDGNNHLFPAFHCLMPNTSSEMYQWVYESAFLEMVGEETIERNQAFFTDGESAMYGSLELLKGTSSPWATTSLFRCVYHMFFQVWNKTVAGKERHLEEKAVMGKVYSFMRHMIYGIQFEHQLNDSMKQFESDLECHKSHLPNSYLPIHRMWYGMKVYRTKWARCFKRNVMDMEKTATSMSESLNSTTKRTCGKSALANSTLELATSKLINHSDYLCERRER